MKSSAFCSESDRGDATCDSCRVDRLDGPSIGGEVSSDCTRRLGWWLQLASQEAVHHPSIPVVLMGAPPMLCERDMESPEVALASFNMAIARLTSWLLVQLGLQSSRDCGPCKPSRVRVQGEARTSGGCTNDDQTDPRLAGVFVYG